MSTPKVDIELAVRRCVSPEAKKALRNELRRFYGKCHRSGIRASEAVKRAQTQRRV